MAQRNLVNLKDVEKGYGSRSVLRDITLGVAEGERDLHEKMAVSANDPGQLRELQTELAALAAERRQLEAAWLEAAEALEA